MSEDIQESFEKTRVAGAIAANALDEVAKIIKPGVSTNDIDNLCYNVINDNGRYSAPLFYRGFPKSCCTSVNHVICHGIPQNKILNEGDIGSTIQNYVEQEGFSVVRDFCGHGIGKVFHKEPNILHYGKKGSGPKLKPGMIFTIEPMINEGDYETKMLNDGWTAVTKDKKLSAQFEHTVGITDKGYEIFTLSKKGLNQPPYSI